MPQSTIGRDADSTNQVANTMNQVANTMRVLGHPVRLAIVREASEGEISVSHLAERLQLPQATTSQHLRALRDGGLVSVRADGNKRFYRTAAQPLSNLGRFIEDLWSRDLEQLKTAAEQRAGRKTTHVR